MLDLETIRAHCLKKEGKIGEDFPFDDVTLVIKVNGKIFILIGTSDHPMTINLKCDPERAIELRERYSAVAAGYHMNKKHWNTVTLDGSVPSKEVLEMIDHSFDLVAKSAKPARHRTSSRKKSR